MDSYDVIVIGGGPTGENVAGRCSSHGLSVALVERELLGGECSYWGCIPSKTLIRPGDVIAAARRVPGAAEAVTGSVDATAAFAQRDYMVSNYDDAGQVSWVEGEGIALVRGQGRLAGEKTVEVERDGTTVTLQARQAVVLATGTSAFYPPIDGLSDVDAWDNRSATEAKEVPRRLLVLGGGTVGVELAQAFRRLGSSEVTVVEAGPRLLAREEPFAAEDVRKAFDAEGIRVLVETKMTAVRGAANGTITATIEGSDGTSSQIEADRLLVGVGRRPRTDDLGLDSVGLPVGKYVEADDQFRATGADVGSWLYAVGDCNGKALLTHMGKYQARLVADIIAGRDVRDVADLGKVPRVTFTDPQVCGVGLTEAQAREQGIDVRVVTTPTGSVAGAYTTGNDVNGTCALVIDESRHVIVGATFTGPGISELLHSATIAVVGEVPLERLWHAVPSFPTISEVWLRLLEAYGL